MKSPHLQVVESSVAKGIAHAIVLELFRCSEYNAWYSGLRESGNPVLHVKSDNHGNRFNYEVLFKADSPPNQDEIADRPGLVERWEDIIWINTAERPYIRICHYPWGFQNGLLVNVPIMTDGMMVTCFSLNPDVYTSCEHIVEKYLAR